MVPYYITFFISCIFCYLGEQSMRRGLIAKENNAEHTVTHQSKKINFNIRLRKSHRRFIIKSSYLYFALSILMVSLLAGVRDYSVGTDIRVYGNDLFYYAKMVSLPTFIERFPYIENLYLVLVYFSAFFSKEPHILYFFTGLIIYSFIMAGMLKFKDRISITFSWFCFLCLLYGDTFNAMRQCLAIGIIVWTFYFAVEKKYIAYVFGTVVAFFFHNSAIIGIIIFAIYKILQINNKLWMKILLVITTVVGLAFFNEILTFLMNMGILGLKMTRYFIRESSGLSIPAILIRLPFLILILVQKKQFCYGENSKSGLKPLSNEAEADFFIVLLFAEMISVELSSFVASLYRIALYFVPFRCMAYARIFAVQKKENRFFYGILLTVYLLIIFIYQNQFKGNNEIYPYIFGKL